MSNIQSYGEVELMEAGAQHAQHDVVWHGAIQGASRHDPQTDSADQVTSELAVTAIPG